ncbi:MAG: response regulator [Burkholderiales bacterium]|nr:response regulator [Burkholderiales bacterium]
MSKRIAIVEDDPAIRANYADALQKHGYQTATYAERGEALAAFATRLPDLAVIDIGLRDEVDGGFELCRALRAQSATLPIIFLTARDSDFDIVSGLRMGADDYLTKDVSLPHLLARIAALFRRAEVAAAPGDLARVEAAMAAAMAPAPDDDLVLALVAPVLAAFPPAEPELRAMAGFLQGMASERRKLREGLAAAQAGSREDRREAQAQRSRAEAQQERADRLQAKLEALTNLEKSLADRPHADDTDRRTR